MPEAEIKSFIPDSFVVVRKFLPEKEQENFFDSTRRAGLPNLVQDRCINILRQFDDSSRSRLCTPYLHEGGYFMGVMGLSRELISPKFGSDGFLEQPMDSFRKIIGLAGDANFPLNRLIAWNVSPGLQSITSVEIANKLTSLVNYSRDAYKACYIIKKSLGLSEKHREHYVYWAQDSINKLLGSIDLTINILWGSEELAKQKIERVLELKGRHWEQSQKTYFQERKILPITAQEGCFLY